MDLTNALRNTEAIGSIEGGGDPRLHSARTHPGKSSDDENQDIRMTLVPAVSSSKLRIAVVGSGIAGMSAAWLLAKHHNVVVYEAADHIGGHTLTADVSEGAASIPVDMGFIVYNEPNYPNLTCLFRHLDVATVPSSMTFAVSLDDGDIEYAGTSLTTLFAQRRNLLRPRFWSMLYGIQRFYRSAPNELDQLDDSLIGLAAYLADEKYPRAFIDDHLLPMAAAIWSAPGETLGRYPVSAFIRFCRNHGLTQFANRPQWRSVAGGSRSYAALLTAAYRDRVRIGRPVRAIRRGPHHATIIDHAGETDDFDLVVIAAHADQALAMLDQPTGSERALLGAFRYERNFAVLHSDPGLMPRRRKIWSSWNYLGSAAATQVSVTYWMNQLQSLAAARDLFVTLNPARPPREGSVRRTEWFEHPIFDAAAIRAQRELWSLQGANRIYFCGAYFGAGFHEDGLQAGLAVAEAIGPVRRPWQVFGQSDRIHLAPPESLAA